MNQKESRNPRTFQYLSDMDTVEEKVFLALAFLNSFEEALNDHLFKNVIETLIKVV